MANGPYSGEYDPVKAMFQTPVRGLSVEGEPTLSFSDHISRYIRFVRMYGSEQQTGFQLHSTSTVSIRCRRDSATESITPACRIIHRSAVYNIVSMNPIDYRLDEMEFICQCELATT